METKKVDLKSLSAEQKQELMAELEAEQKAVETKKADERITYKELVVETVETNFLELSKLSNLISDVKALVFNNFALVIEMKKELYNVKDNQQSHTFSNTDSSLSITMGYRVIDNYDDTVNSGIEMVKVWIKKQATDEKAAGLVDIINNLLKSDQNGNLKASRVLELQNHADKIKDPELTEGVRVIREAYKPKKTKYFVEANFAGKGGEKLTLPLSITSAPFPEPAGEVNI